MTLSENTIETKLNKNVFFTLEFSLLVQQQKIR